MWDSWWMNCGLAWLLEEWFNAVHVIKEDIRDIFAYMGYHKSFNVSHEMPFNSSTLAHLLGCVVLQINRFMDSWFVKIHYFLMCSVTAIVLTSRLTGILPVSSEILYSVLFFFTVAVSGCDNENVLLCFHNCNYFNCVYLCFSSLQTKLANEILCNSLLTLVMLFPFTFCLFTVDLQSCRQACLVVVNSVHSGPWWFVNLYYSV